MHDKITISKNIRIAYGIGQPEKIISVREG